MKYTPGAVYMKLRQFFRGGLASTFYRRTVLPKILDSTPVRETEDSSAEIHVLTSAGDWLEALWMLKSFYYFSRKHYALCIHDDGSLGDPEIAALREHFPLARVITRSRADSEMKSVLRGHPRSAEFRDTNPLALKVYDSFALAKSERLLFIDSDILFFDRPAALLARLEDPNYQAISLNRDWTYGYSVQSEEVRHLLDFDLQPRVNSGLGIVQRAAIRLDDLEGFMELPGILSHHHRVEQTLIALYSCQHGFEFLPQEYDVHMHRATSTLPCRHYSGPIRHLLYSEGLKRLERVLLAEGPE